MSAHMRRKKIYQRFSRYIPRACRFFGSCIVRDFFHFLPSLSVMNALSADHEVYTCYRQSHGKKDYRRRGSI